MICPVCEHDNPGEARFCGSCGVPLEDESAHARELIGQTVGGRYVIQRVIGEGGMGVVYVAEQRMGSATRTVAVKTLLPWLSRDPSVRSRFYREGGTVSQLEHPNTVRVYDFGEAPDGRLYIAMEYVRGESLTSVIERGPIAAVRVKHILRQVCGALEEAHQQGIVHRDLKPDNIVLSQRGGETDFVKVLDFGIAAHTGPTAKRQTKLTQQGTVLGTPPYMSPEQLTGEAVDSRSDVYSLGVIAYEMLTGKLPFEADSPFAWAQKHLSEQPRPLTTVTDRPIPAEMERAVLGALAKRPADRPATAMQFYRLLVGEAPMATTQPDAAERTTPMPAPPDFSRHQTELGGQPAFRTGAAVAAPIPAPPSTRTRRRHWVGWTFATAALAALGAILLSTGVVRVPGSTTSAGGSAANTGGGAAQTSAGTGGSSTTEIAPLIDAASQSPPPEVSQSIPEEPVSKAPRKKSEPKEQQPPLVPPPPPVQQPPAQPPPAQPPPAQPPPAQPPHEHPQLPPPPQQPMEKPRLKLPPTGGAPNADADALCKQSEQAANGGNIEGAVALYNKCASQGGSTNALGAARYRIRNRAPDVVKQRGFNGDCAGARSAANAASSIGAGDRAQAALAQTSCK